MWLRQEKSFALIAVISALCLLLVIRCKGGGGGSADVSENPQVASQIPSISVTKITGETLELPYSSGFHDFGNVANAAYPGTPGPEIEFRISNSGTGSLQLTGSPSQVILSGTNPGEFQVTQQPGAVSLTAGAAIVFKMRFKPTSNGNKTATVHIANNTVGKTTFIFGVRGNATSAPAAEINIQQFSGTVQNLASLESRVFPNTQILTTSIELTFNVQNLGLANLNLTSSPYVLLTGVNASDFQISTQPAVGSLNPGQSATFSVRFSPTTIGTKTAALQIASNDSDETPFTINLSGLAFKNAPEIEIKQGATSIASGGSYNFSGTRVASAKDVVFSIRNEGGLGLTLTGSPKVAVSGSDAAMFQVLSQPAGSIAPFDETTFGVRFNPTSSGAKSASLNITNNDANESSYAISLSGSGSQASGPCLDITSNTVNTNFAAMSNYYGPGETGFYTSMFSTTVGPANPSLIFSATQSISNTNPILISLYSDSGVYNPYFDSKGGVGETDLSFMYPYGTSAGEFLNYNGTTGSLPVVTPAALQNVYFDFTTPVNFAASPMDYNLVRGCEPRLLEDMLFTPDSNGTSTNGMSKVWSVTKKLNVKFIFIQGTYPTYTTTGIQQAVDRMKNIYAQNSVKIDLQFSATSINASEFQSLSNISDQTGVLPESLSKLYIGNPGTAQSTQALNIYITSEETEVGGTLGLSSGTPGIPGIIGQTKVGIVIFIESHRSSGSPGSALNTSDLQFLGSTLAHESAHYLGLFHLNEGSGFNASATILDRLWGADGKDALAETPYCTNSNDTSPADGMLSINECSGTGFTNSGSSNLMFWVRDGVTLQNQLTGEQGWVLRGHPLVY